MISCSEHCHIQPCLMKILKQWVVQLGNVCYGREVSHVEWLCQLHIEMHDSRVGEGKGGQGRGEESR